MNVVPALFTLVKKLSRLFESPQFRSGERVNATQGGHLVRVDGRVLAQTPKGVLVEWPRGGQSWEDPRVLCAQAG